MQSACALSSPVPVPVAGVEIQYVPRDRVRPVWDAILPQVERALARGMGDGTKPQYLLDAILQEHAQLWVARDEHELLAGIVISVKIHAACDKLVVQVVAGKDMKRWMPLLLQHLEEMRKLTGTKCVEAFCRPGIAKYLKQLGCKQKAIVMEL